MSGMRERVARAIYERPRFDGRQSRSLKSWDDLREADRTMWRRNADAALDALREPDEAMLRSGGSAFDHPSVYMGGPSSAALRTVPKIWQAMLDAIAHPLKQEEL